MTPRGGRGYPTSGGPGGYHSYGREHWGGCGRPHDIPYVGRCEGGVLTTPTATPATIPSTASSKQTDIVREAGKQPGADYSVVSPLGHPNRVRRSAHASRIPKEGEVPAKRGVPKGQRSLVLPDAPPGGAEKRVAPLIVQVARGRLLANPGMPCHCCIAAGETQSSPPLIVDACMGARGDARMHSPVQTPSEGNARRALPARRKEPVPDAAG